MTQTYTIKPLAWEKLEIESYIYNPNGTTIVKVHYTASSILNYQIGPLPTGGYRATAFSVTADGNEEFYDADTVESLDSAKEWCNKHLLDYLLEALEPTSVVEVSRAEYGRQDFGRLNT